MNSIRQRVRFLESAVGFSMIEALLSVVIAGVVVLTSLNYFSSFRQQDANTMYRQNALDLAQSMIEERYMVAQSDTWLDPGTQTFYFDFNSLPVAVPSFYTVDTTVTPNRPTSGIREFRVQVRWESGQNAGQVSLVGYRNF